MKYLLDTHVFLWMINGDTDCFSEELLQLLQNTENDLFLSSASIWEMMIKSSINRLSIPNGVRKTGQIYDLVARLKYGLSD